MTSDELLEIELPSLRDEMLEVKKCQHQLFIFEIIAAGAVISFLLPLIPKMNDTINFWSVFFLSPVVIIVPFQYIILDKALTINRICGYFKVIEKRIADQRPINFFAWENGCAEFRRISNTLEPSGLQNPTQGPNSFYKINFFITFFIALILIILMALFYTIGCANGDAKSTEILIMVCLSMTILAAFVHQFILLRRILKGKYTILAMADLWENII